MHERGDDLPLPVVVGIQAPAVVGNSLLLGRVALPFIHVFDREIRVDPDLAQTVPEEIRRRFGSKLAPVQFRLETEVRSGPRGRRQEPEEVYRPLRR